MLELKIVEENRIDPKAQRVYLLDNTGQYATTTTNVINMGQPIPITSGGTIPAQSISVLATSPTGYGGLNQTRESIAVFPIGCLVSSKGNKSPLKFDAYNPALDTKWSAQVPTDGWLSFRLVYCPQEASPVLSDYQVGEFVYDTDSNQLLKVSLIQNVPDFELAEPEDLVVNNSSPIFDQLFIGNTSLTKIHLNKKYSELLLNNENLSNKKDLDYIDNQYKLVRYLLESAIYEFVIGNKYESARILEFLLTNNYNSL